MDALHAIAWPAAREFFNRKYAEVGPRNDLGWPVEPLPPDYYTKPSSMTKRGELWALLYGGAPAGPAILVLIDAPGDIKEIKAWFAAK